MKIEPLMIFLCSILFMSCQNSKKITEDLRYFKDTANHSSFRIKDIEPVLQKGDLLTIIISTADPKTDALLNSNIAVSLNSSLPANLPSYLVGNSGEITMPLLGKIKVEGMKKSDLVNLLQAKYKDVAKSPSVSIRYLNYHITVLGEVNKPGTYTIPNERVTLIEALGLASDLTIYGKRNNVMIIRENDGILEYGQVDLNKKNIAASPYYFLNQNDVVYVEMDNRKVVNTDVTSSRNTNIFLGVLSTVAILITAFKR